MRNEPARLRWIIEMDGVVFDPRPAYWEAYRQAAAAVGAACTEPARFWSLMRTDAPRGQLVAHASASQTQQFCALFEEALEADDCLAACEPHPEIRGQLARLGQALDRVLVTGGRNRTARQLLLKREDLDALFMEMAVLSTEPARRGAELRALGEGHPQTVLVAASPEVLRSAGLAGLITIGCASGRASARHLTQAGAGWVVADLQELIDALATGGGPLQSIGVHVPPQR